MFSLNSGRCIFLDLPTQTNTKVSFRVKRGDGSYVVCTAAGQIKCFECGNVGHNPLHVHVEMMMH